MREKHFMLTNVKLVYGFNYSVCSSAEQDTNE
jgi:hypothetical protein